MDNLIEHFMREPEREFHLRQLAKLTGKSPTTASKYLAKLEKNGLLVSERRLRHLLYRANTESAAFKDLKIYRNVKALRESGLISFLVEELNNPEAIILFGSYRKGEDSLKSDIDLLVITPLKKALNLEKFEKVLEHPVQLFLHSSAEIGKMKTKNKELLNSFANGIVLQGYLELYK